MKKNNPVEIHATAANVLPPEILKIIDSEFVETSKILLKGVPEEGGNASRNMFEALLFAAFYGGALTHFEAANAERKFILEEVDEAASCLNREENYSAKSILLEILRRFPTH